MNILITGAAGQRSSYLFEEADVRNHDAWGVDIVPPGNASAKDKVEIIDIRDTEKLAKSANGADVIIHTAAQVSVQKSLMDPVFDADINVLGTVSALKAAVDSGVKKFIFISSAAVYGNPVSLPISEMHPVNPLSVYGASKLAAEGYVRMFENTYGLKTIIIRPFNFYSSRADADSPYSGVITKFSECVKNNSPITIDGDGMQTRDFLHAADVSKFIHLAMESDVSGVTFNCGSGKAISINELAEKMISVSSKNIDIVHSQPRTADIKHSVADVRLAEELLDFHTSVTIEEGLKELFTSQNQLSAKMSISMQ